MKSDNLNVDILIIGAGAAGMVASISAARYFREVNNKKYNILIVEKGNKAGKKILATGNGKCNISNTNLRSKFYYGSNNNLLDKFLNMFGFKDVERFFNSVGLFLKIDECGRAYPINSQASSVRELLLDEIKRLEIDLLYEVYINNIKKNYGGFIVKGDKFNINCKKVIVATGGNACPFKEYNGDGYNYMKSLGHSVSEIFPALVPVKCGDSNVFKILKGVRWKGEVKLISDGRLIKNELGEIQFTENGLSGICIFQISRLISEFIFTGKINSVNTRDVIIEIDLIPNYSKDKIEYMINNGIKQFGYMKIENLLWGLLNKNVGRAILRRLNIEFDRPSNKLSKLEVKEIVRTVKKFRFIPSGIMDWSNAQVTAGGIPIDEVNIDTFESKIVRGLYAVGELLDVDGICGGYNLHFAWGSGYISGRSAAKKIMEMEN